MSSEPTIPNLEIKILKLCWHKPMGKNEVVSPNSYTQNGLFVSSVWLKMVTLPLRTSQT